MKRKRCMDEQITIAQEAGGKTCQDHFSWVRPGLQRRRW